MVAWAYDGKSYLDDLAKEKATLRRKDLNSPSSGFADEIRSYM